MIDEIDRRIVTHLQADARLSNSALAEKVGLTSSTVHDRVKKLERKGVIKGYVAVVDPEPLGKPITAFVRLIMAAGATSYTEAKQDIHKVCLAEPDVLECHTVAGEDCYILKVRVASTKQLEHLVERLRSNANISRSTTSIVLSTVKEGAATMPLGLDA